MVMTEVKIRIPGLKNEMDAKIICEKISKYAQVKVLHAFRPRIKGESANFIIAQVESDKYTDLKRRMNSIPITLDGVNCGRIEIHFVRKLEPLELGGTEEKAPEANAS